MIAGASGGSGGKSFLLAGIPPLFLFGPVLFFSGESKSRPLRPCRPEVSE